MNCNISQDKLMTKERIDDVVQLLVTGFLRFKQRSELNSVSGDNSVDFIATPSIHADSNKS